MEIKGNIDLNVVLQWMHEEPVFSYDSRARLARGKNVGGGEERLRDSVSHLQGGHRIAASSVALLQSRLPPQLPTGKPAPTEPYLAWHYTLVFL